MPPTLTPLGSRIAGAVLGALLDPAVFRATQRAASSFDGFASEHSQYNLMGLEYLASRSSWEASSPMNLESYIPYWKIRTLAAGGGAADADRQVLAQLNASEMSYEVVGVYSKAVMLRHAAAYGVFDDEETLLQAVSAMMFMYRNDSLKALSSADFIARVAFRLVHSEKTTPRRLLEEVPKAQWLQRKLKEVKEKVKEAMDVKSQLFQQDSVDDYALRSMGRVWQKADSLRRLGSWASEVLPNSLYFILKYEHDLMAALEANAKVHGAGSRAVVIGLVLGAFHGHGAFVDVTGAKRVLRLLRKLPLLRGKHDGKPRLLPPKGCFDSLYTAFSCCGPHEPPGMTCWMTDLKENCCHGIVMALRNILLRRLEQMKEEKRCGKRPEDYLGLLFMMQSYPKEIATAVPGASDGSAADPGAEAARHWCSLAALQEDEREATLRLYDAMAEKMVMTGRLVNLGAGSWRDPLWELVEFRNVTRAVFVDPGGPPEGVPRSPRAVRFLNESAEPQNLKALLRKGQLLPRQPGFSLPVEVDFLKVDVDGCDCGLASKVLHLIRPKVIIMEINWSIPPPLRFVRHCHEDWWKSWETWGSIGFVLSTHGCSLMGASSTLEPFGFALWRLQGHVNAVFLRRDVQEALGQRRADETACFNEAWKNSELVRYVHFSLADDWRRGSGQDALKHACGNISCYHSLLDISHIPFSLTL